MARHKEQPINWLLAVMLERKATRKWTFSDLSAKTGYTPEHLSVLFGQDPWKWTVEARTKVCSALGIDKTVQADCFSRQ